jgi:hypothetical protein
MLRLVKKEMTFTAILRFIVDNIAFSHGYTLSIWSAGMLAIRRYGSPKVRDIVLFLVGASFAYSVLAVTVILNNVSEERLVMGVGTSALELAPLTSVISVALVTRIIRSKGVGYLVTGFVTTLVYVVILALLLSEVMS